MNRGPIDHGVLDYWAMGFALVLAFALWLWLGGLPETTAGLVFRLVVLAIGGGGLVTCLVLKRRWS